ncbi:hypothetical protein [Nostoc sp.]
MSSYAFVTKKPEDLPNYGSNTGTLKDQTEVALWQCRRISR